MEHSGGAIWADLVGREWALDDDFPLIRATDVQFLRKTAMEHTLAMFLDGLIVDPTRFGLIGPATAERPPRSSPVATPRRGR